MNTSFSQDAEEIFFTEGHQWIRFEDDIAFIGLTHHAKKELGPVKHIEIHTIGRELQEDQAFGRITSNRYLCKLIMPFSGIVVEANTINYNTFNETTSDFDPSEWIVRIGLSRPLVSRQLHSLTDYRSQNQEPHMHLVKYFLRLDG
jgi:glycine cleavage system H protein